MTRRARRRRRRSIVHPPFSDAAGPTREPAHGSLRDRRLSYPQHDRQGGMTMTRSINRMLRKATLTLGALWMVAITSSLIWNF